jgi:hypothetical protein
MMFCLEAVQVLSESMPSAHTSSGTAPSLRSAVEKRWPAVRAVTPPKKFWQGKLVSPTAQTRTGPAVLVATPGLPS